MGDQTNSAIIHTIVLLTDYGPTYRWCSFSIHPGTGRICLLHSVFGPGTHRFSTHNHITGTFRALTGHFIYYRYYQSYATDILPELARLSRFLHDGNFSHVGIWPPSTVPALKRKRFLSWPLWKFSDLSRARGDGSFSTWEGQVRFVLFPIFLFPSLVKVCRLAFRPIHF